MTEPVVFLSFAAEDAAWKANFVKRTWFGDILGPVEMFDYQAGNALSFGPMTEWLTNRVRSAAAFIAFVSKSYIQKELTLLEWHAALPEACKQELIFVPVLLDASARQWWASLKQKGQLRDLGDDYAYADFTDGNGKPRPIVTEDGHVDIVTRKISELARLIKENLRRARRDVPPSLPEPPAPVVVLGHPTAVSDPDVTRLVDSFTTALGERGRLFVRWGDRWRIFPSARHSPASLTSEKAFFVQPAGAGDAGDLAKDSNRLRIWLDQALTGAAGQDASAEGFKTVLWLPAGVDDEGFDAAMADQTGRGGHLILRHDDPDGLAAWVHAQLRSTPPLPEVPIITLEEVDRNDAGRLRDSLHSGFKAVVDGVIQPPPETWTFQGDMLVSQISKLDSDRAIVAVHDLNTGTSNVRREARQQLEQKLGAVERDVDRAIKSAGRRDLKLFWTALLVQKAEQLPWVKYPSPSRFEDWCLLPFAPTRQGSDTDPVLRPKPVETDVFRTYLRDWVNGAPACGRCVPA
jgi:hypothetical protein